MNNKQVYELVHSSDPNELSRFVDDRIAEGWWPIGRPFVHGEQYIQAMVLGDSHEGCLIEVGDDTIH
jgi:hypothetical protein